MARKKVLVVLEDQSDDGSGRALDEARIVYDDTLSYYTRGRQYLLGVEFTAPDGKTTFIVPEGSIARVVKIRD